jgi:teichuronic acid exporter
VPSIKQKTISGILWSSVDNFINLGIVFIVGIILARLLDPKEFGLIGMITIFIAVSEVFIKSGFGEALIRKKDCTQIDFSTVFFFNLSAGIIFFSILFITAPYISSFFREPVLKSIVRVLAIVLIIDSMTIIQHTTLVKRVDFKLQARISFIASTGSGIVAIILAYRGLGVWSLVALTHYEAKFKFIVTLALEQMETFTCIFSKNSFKELFGFGNKLLLSGLIDTVYNNLYYLIIGKYFSATELGFYTRANNFSNFPSHNINTVVGRVTYPVLSDMQDYPDLLKTGYRRIIKSTMLITFVLMLGLARNC